MISIGAHSGGNRAQWRFVYYWQSTLTCTTTQTPTPLQTARHTYSAWDLRRPCFPLCRWPVISNPMTWVFALVKSSFLNSNTLTPDGATCKQHALFLCEFDTPMAINLPPPIPPPSPPLPNMRAGCGSWAWVAIKPHCYSYTDIPKLVSGCFNNRVYK